MFVVDFILSPFANYVFVISVITVEVLTVDVISGQADTAQEFARWRSVVVSLMVAVGLFVVVVVDVPVFAVGGLPIRTFFYVALLLLLLTFTF